MVGTEGVYNDGKKKCITCHPLPVWENIAVQTKNKVQYI